MPSLRSRRGHKSCLTGLALAPPDAAPTNYTHLTPPPTASKPSDDQDTPISTQKDISTTCNNDQNSSRFRGTPRSWSPSQSRGLTTPHIPLTPSPMFSPVTPDIGQGKDINIPVTGPIVVNLLASPSSISSRSNNPFPDAGLLRTPTSSTASSYRHYQPGVHSIAGPLPPPRANFNINIHNPPPPRPPRFNSPTPTRSRRDLDAVKQSLQLPPSVTAILASKSSNLSNKEDLNNDLFGS